MPGTFDDDSVYERLDEQLKEFDKDAGIEFNRLFYLSTAPAFFPVIVGKLGEHGLNRHEQAEVRVVIEKPFGTRLAEALELNRQVLSVLDESQVFRIDHYLGKETVQNMLAFRFANGLFEPIWNRNYIDYVQITAAGGPRRRHPRRVLRHVGRAARPGREPHDAAADPAVHGAAGHLHRRRRARREGEGAARDQAGRPSSQTVRARYTAGMAEGKEVPGYLEEEGVPADSQTETYAALRLEVDNWRWAGIPIYMRTGKRLARKITEIAITLEAGAAPGVRVGRARWACSRTSWC